MRYDVTLPDLDAQRIRIDAQTRAALVEAAGQSLREVTADVRYADRAAAFSATVAASDARTLDAAGTLALPQPAGVDVRLDRLTATAEGTSWSLTEPARSSTPAIGSTSIAWPWPAGRRRSKRPDRSPSATRRRVPCRRIGRCRSP